MLRVHQLGELVDYEGVSSLLGISKRTVRRLVDAAALVPVYVSARRPRFAIEAVAEFRLRRVRRPAATDRKVAV